jgi:hypothetical protein
VFFIIANLPFLTIIHLFGIETFLDSFRNPDSYHCIKTDKIPNNNAYEGYILLEKTDYRKNSIMERDTILYYTTKDTLQQRIVFKIVSENDVNRYYMISNNNEDITGPIYEHQIIGKIKARVENSVWNMLCIQIWDFSIDALNVITLFTIL